MQPEDKITIVGAGSGALGYAYLCQEYGCEVLIYNHPDHQNTRKTAEKRGYIGVKEGDKTRRMHLAFKDNAKDAHAFSKTIGWSVRGDHTVVFFPGFREELSLPPGVKFKDIFQTSYPPIGTLLIDEGIDIIGWKDALVISGSLGSDRRKAAGLLPGIGLRWAINEIDLETQYFPAIIHVCRMAGNTERIASGEEWLFYKDGLQESVIDNILAVFVEIQYARESLGYESHDLMFLINEFYPHDFKSLRDFRERMTIHGGVKGPKTFEHRWLMEETSVHLVFCCELLGMLGSRSERLKKVIRKAGQLVGKDFFGEGSELKQKRLVELGREEFIALLGRRGSGDSSPESSVSTPAEEVKQEE